MKKYTQPQAQLVNLSTESIIASSPLNINNQGTSAPALSQKFENSDWDEEEE